MHLGRPFLRYRCNGHRKSRKKKQRRKIYPARVKKLLHKKTKAWRRYRKTNSVTRRLKYDKCAKLFSSELKKHAISVENKLIDNGNLTNFYKYVSQKTKSKNTIPPLINSEGSMLLQDGQKAECLSSHFSSVFMQDNGIVPDINEPLESVNVNEINSVYFSPYKIAAKIEKLKNHSSPGWDGIPVILLKSLWIVYQFHCQYYLMYLFLPVDYQVFGNIQ